MKKVIVFFNEEKSKARVLVPKLKTWLKKRGIAVMTDYAFSLKGQKIDLAIALGGDGTMLKAARKIAPFSIPLFGINVGSLGFLAEMDWHQVYPMLDRVLKKKVKPDQRSMLSVNVRSRSRDRHASGEAVALNDCVVRCGGNARIIALDVWVGNKFLSEYHGDGVIISTPTGSTAYALAASGPIVHPRLDVMIVTPICPHMLAQRPIILPSHSDVRIVVREHDPKDRVIVSLDGQVNLYVREHNEICVRRSAYDLYLFTNPCEDYFSILRKKLAWGKRGGDTPRA